MLGVFGSGLTGRAFAVREVPQQMHTEGPTAYESPICIAFRGIRASKSGKLEADIVDTLALIDAKFDRPKWLPNGKVSNGAVTFHDALWAKQHGQGLLHWLQELSVDRSGGNHSTQASPLLFIGHSFGGALAQMTALRAILEFPELCSCTHVLAFGATPWANHQVADLFKTTFHERASHLVTVQWVKVSAESNNPGTRREDPLTQRFLLQQSELHGKRLLSALPVEQPECDHDASVLSLAQGTLDLPKRPAGFTDDCLNAVEPGTYCQTDLPLCRSKLFQLLQGKLPDEHPLCRGYMLMHRGLAYRNAMLAIFQAAHATCSQGHQGASLVAMRRNNSSKRSLDNMMGDEEVHFPRNSSSKSSLVNMMCSLQPQSSSESHESLSELSMC